MFALLHNASILLKSVIASIIKRSGHIGAVIASYSYCSTVSLKVSVIASIRYRFTVLLQKSIKSRRCLFLQRYSDNAMLQLALLHYRDRIAIHNTRHSSSGRTVGVPDTAHM